MKTYTIVAADSTELLADRVNGYLQQGGELVGGVAVFALKNSGLPVFLQAMLVKVA